MAEQHLDQSKVDQLGDALVRGKRVIYMDEEIGNARLVNIYSFGGESRLQLKFGGKYRDCISFMCQPNKFHINGKPAFEDPTTPIEDK